MRRQIIFTIFRKELREVLRDKRMVYMVILLPFFLYPILFFIIGKVSKSQSDKLSREKVTLLLDPATEATPIYNLLKTDTSFVVALQSFDRAALDTLEDAIGISVEGDYAATQAARESSVVKVTGDFTRDLLDSRRQVVLGLLTKLNQVLLEQRLQAMNLPPAFAQPLLIQEEDLASTQQRFGKAIGGYMPMLLLLFIFIGCIYISIDITAGEKERRTIQTLFTAPVHVREIIAGKFLAVATVGIVSASMNLLSLVLAMMMQVRLMGDSLGQLSISISPQGWMWLIVLVVLSTIFLAALSLAVTLLANSYKESQSYVSPLMMLVLIPSMIAQMPGMELDASTAMVPMFNICLAIAAIFKGTLVVKWMAMVVFWGVVYALLALFLASRTFGNENVITGEKVSLKRVLKGA